MSISNAEALHSSELALPLFVGDIEFPSAFALLGGTSGWVSPTFPFFGDAFVSVARFHPSFRS